MKSPFNIIYKPSDWAEHDRLEQAQACSKLQDTASAAKLRNLEQSAERFRPANDLINSINAALVSRVPLLLTGEPGTGKTQVAWFIKRFFDIPLFSYQVHSNSQAADLRYDFDAVAYLRDAYLARHGDNEDRTREKQNTPNSKNTDDPRSHPKYLKPGVLWKAYHSDQWENPVHVLKGECVLLIDEIDKAPRDFPNDLLQELDQHRFEHPFHQGKYIERGTAPPIIIVTSNGERRLPDAFLRRCIVHHIELTNELLKDIMQAWQVQFPNLSKEARELALQRFQEIRKNNRLSKKPGAAELLLWLGVLSAQGIKPDQLDTNTPLRKLPALICLIKDHADYKHLESH